MHNDLTNTTLAERYHLLRVIGQGGFATVYEARDLKLDKTVAVKVLSPRFAAKEEYRRRFLQEARAAARLRHRLLVDVTDHGLTPDGLLFFVMEHLPGDSLGDRLREQPGPLPWRSVLAITIEVVKALEVAHQHGIVHRDVKPGNVFLVGGHLEGPDLQVKLLDLGIAKVHYDVPEDEMPETRESQGAPGTPEYMAPEQIRVGAKGPSVDLYAVGVLLYRLLTGALPFTSRMSWEVLLMHRDTPPVPPTTRAPDAQIPPALEAVVLRLMAKDPDARYASATELRLVLQDLLTQEGTHEQERQRAHRPIDAPAARRGLFAPERLGRWATRFMVGTTAATTFMVANLFSLRAADPPLLPAPEFEQEQEQEITVDAPAPPSEPTPGPIHAAPGDTAPASTDLPDDPDNDPDDGDFQIPTDPSTPRTRPRPIDQDPGGLLPIGSTGKGKKDPYQKALAKARASVITACKRSVATTITAEIEIDPATGRVTADLLGDRSSAAACVKKHLDALTFPRSKDGDLAPIHRRETFPL